MDSGIYAACAALKSRTQALDSVANNLANVSTSGYRSVHNTFHAVLANFGPFPTSQLDEAVNDFGVLGGANVDVSQGALEPTGNPLDFGLEGPGFFVVQTPAGRVLTRNGSFHISAQGQLITSDGDPVMGEEGIIRIPGTGPINVSVNGTISVNGALAGKLKIVEVAGAQLESVGSTYYRVPAGSEKPSPSTQVHQGMVESSNVNAVASAVELVLIQRNAEMMQRALSMFHTDFNKVATEDVPRVG